MWDVVGALSAAWAFARDAAMWRFAYRRDRREAAPQRLIAAGPAEDLSRWRLDVLPAPGEWRLAQLSCRQDLGHPRWRLKRISLLGPLGARIAPGDPASAAAAWGLFDGPDAARAGAWIDYDAEMPDATPDLENVRSPFPGLAYARIQFFAAPPRHDGAVPAPLQIEIEASSVDAARRALTLRLDSDPMR